MSTNIPTTDGTYDAVTYERLTDTTGFYVSRPFGYAVNANNPHDIANAVVTLSMLASETGDDIGIWTDHGVTYVDRTVRVSGSRAVDLGWKNGQAAVWDIARGVAVPVSEPVGDPIDGVQTIRRVGTVRGHAFICEEHGVLHRGVTYGPVRTALQRHLWADHDVRPDEWDTRGGEDTFVESNTGHILTVRRDTDGSPDSFGWSWSRVSSEGEHASGVAGNRTAARVLAQMSN